MKSEIKNILIKTGLFQMVYAGISYTRSIRFLTSNWKHYAGGAPDGLPVPPIPLIMLVAGKPDAELFLQTGRRAEESIRDALLAQGLSIKDFDSILDFGCGCGRVLRYWRDLQAKIYGVDYNPKLVQWCRRNIPFGIFQKNDLRPPLYFPDDSFDFVYALSVFTHLTGELQLSWMRELKRVLRKNGLLLITTHGEYYFDQLNDSEREQFRTGHLVIKGEGQEGSNWLGAYHPKQYVTEELAREWKLISFIPEGAKGNPFQDLYLFRKVG